VRPIVILVTLSTVLLSQVPGSRGSIEGRVLDNAEAPVVTARVLVIQSSSGLERETVTDVAGVYRVPSLLPGAYEVRVEAGSISTIIRDVTVRVGATTQIQVRVDRQTQTDTLVVSNSVLSVADAEMTQVLPFEAIRDLPINGRRFQDFVTLTPAVIARRETLGQLSFVGQRGVNSNVLIDGTDYNEPFVGGIRGGDRSNLTFTIPQSAIQEFQTVTSGYSAEYGRSTGGVLNAITRTGTNGLHGEGFYLLRHSALSSADPFGLEALENQHQFGGGVGGPLIKDRLFFFGAVEQQLSRFPRQVRFAALDSVARTNDIAPAYDLFRSLETPFRQTNDSTAILGRADYRLSSHLFAGRYQWSRNDAENAAALGTSIEPLTNRALSSNGREKDTIRTAALQVTSVIRPELLNDFRAQYSHEFRNRMPNATVPNVNAGAIGEIGTPALFPMQIKDRRVQVADAVTWLSGSHSLKLGVDYSHIAFMQWYGDNQFGSFLIANSDVRRVLQILSASNRFDDPSVIYRRQVGVLQTERSANQIALFAQDSWRLLPNFTLNLGVRWEAQINPRPVADNPFLVNSVKNFNFPLGRVDPTVMRNSLDQWAPRIGFAWSPGSEKTVIRAQAGLFYGQTPFILYASPLDSFSTAPSDLSLQIAPNANGTVYRQFRNAGFDLAQGRLDQLRVFTVPEIWMDVAGRPDPFAQANVVTTSGDNFRNPRSAQLNLGVQQQVSSGLSFDYQLNYVNTVNLVRNVDFNVPRPFVRPGDSSERPFFGLRSGTLRPNPDLGQVLVRDSSARSRYVGQSFRVQLRRGPFEGAASYTLGFNKSDDDSERAISGFVYQNPFDFSREYNWSALDARHMAAGYLLWRGPAGFDVASVVRCHSGLPVDATTGEDTSELLSGALGNRPLERPGIPFLRNAFRNRAYGSMDMRLLKSFPVREAVRLQFSVEAFNLWNNQNVAFRPASVSSENAAFRYGLGILPNGQTAPVNPGFLGLRLANGEYDPGTTYQQGNPRQLQLGVRFIF
jgi:hypothetical protein